MSDTFDNEVVAWVKAGVPERYEAMRAQGYTDRDIAALWASLYAYSMGIGREGRAAIVEQLEDKP